MKLSTTTRNFTALLGSNFAVQALRFLTIALLARRLGNSLFGVYNYVILLVSYGFTLVEFGLKNFAIREIAQGRGSSNLVKQILRTRIVLALLGVAGVLVFAGLAFPAGTYFWPSVFLSLSLFIDAFLLDFVIIAQERLTAQAMANVAQALFMYLAVLFLVKSNEQLLLVSQLFLVSHVLWVSLFFISAKRFKLSHDADFNQKVWRTAWQGFPFLLAQFLGGLQFSMDLLLLGQFHYESWLGDYGAALKILGITLGIINAFTAAVQPRLARESHDLHSVEMQNLINHTTRIIWLFIAPTLVGCWLFGDQLVLWFFGSSFVRAGMLLRPLSLALALFCLGLAPMHGLLISHKTRLMVKVEIFNVLASLIVIAAILSLGRPDLVPWGMVGVQGLYMIVAWRLFKSNEFLALEDFNTVLLPVGLMLIPFMTPDYVPPIFKFTAAALGYVAGLVVVKVWRRPAFKAILGKIEVVEL